MAPSGAGTPASPFKTKAERAAERDRKREAVLLAAVTMFDARGFHATSLDDVAASLGISKPTIYHYLGNKDQVLLECILRGLAQLQAAAADARAGPGSGLDRLRVFLRQCVEINATEFGRCSVRIDESALSPDSARRFRDVKRRIDNAMRGLIEEAVADGSAGPLDVRATNYVLAGAVNWVGRWYHAGGELEAAALARAMVDSMVRGLAPRVDEP